MIMLQLAMYFLNSYFTFCQKESSYKRHFNYKLLKMNSFHYELFDDSFTRFNTRTDFMNTFLQMEIIDFLNFDLTQTCPGA